MKKKIKESFLYLALAFILLIIVSSLEGYISIKIMTIIDSAMAQKIDSFKTESINVFIAVALLLPMSVLASLTKGLYIKKALVTAKVYYIEKVFKKNINEFQAENNAKYLSTITNDMNTIEHKYLEGIYEVGSNFIGFIVIFIVIASVSPLVLFIGITLALISGILSIIVGKPLQKHEKNRSDLFSGYTSYIKEVLGAFQIIKSNNLMKKVGDDFKAKSKAIQHKGYLIDKIYTYVVSFQFLVTNCAHLGILVISAYMSIKGDITVGAVILIVTNMGKVIYPLMDLSEWFPKLFSVKSIFKRIEDSLENHDNYEESLELNNFNENIEFKGVSFSYGDNEILKDVNLKLKKGEKYLIVGPSGEGKSTLLRLLRKYFNPNNGEILIDGKNLKYIKKRSYFENISNIEQDVFLFEDSLRNNLTLYKNYDDIEINQAIKNAGLKKFVDALDNGLNSNIYDNGRNISGGEKSRIAIARGLLTNSNIIFLDEAFASLDSKVAKEIEDTLLNLVGITVVNVSHVIFKETRDRYNRVIVVKNKTVR